MTCSAGSRAAHPGGPGLEDAAALAGLVCAVRDAEHLLARTREAGHVADLRDRVPVRLDVVKGRTGSHLRTAV